MFDDKYNDSIHLFDWYCSCLLFCLLKFRSFFFIENCLNTFRLAIKPAFFHSHIHKLQFQRGKKIRWNCTIYWTFLRGKKYWWWHIYWWIKFILINKFKALLDWTFFWTKIFNEKWKPAELFRGRSLISFTFSRCRGLWDFVTEQLFFLYKKYVTRENLITHLLNLISE